VRFRLLGENLIAFRDTAGRVGIMDHRCPHRCASLFFGRNEDGGLRCVYHGWKFDTDGNCLDMANVPPHQDFKHKVHAKAYKVAERSGLVWTYMGARAVPPPMPQVEATTESDIEITFSQRDCNWLQALEGDIDTSHLGFLHLGAVNKQTFQGTIDENVVANRTPEYICEETPFGTTYGAFRPSEDGGTYWRFAHYLFPFWTLPPINPFEINMLTRAWVPLDDTHMMFVMVAHKDSRPGARNRTATPVGTAVRDTHLPNTTDWLGRWRLRGNRANDYEIDREVQRTQSYTGIEGIHMQDQAVTESMGEITDHTWEHLAPSDLMITKTRRRILSALQAHMKDGTVPPAVDDPEVQSLQRGGSFVAPRNLDWRAAYEDRIRRDVTSRRRAAE
jgi:phthalate 4,5-dioxygenase